MDMLETIVWAIITVGMVITIAAGIIILVLYVF